MIHPTGSPATDDKPAKGWSVPAKITAGSAIGLLLSLGLCAVSGGPVIEGGGNFLTSASLVLFLLSALGLFIGILSLIISAFTRKVS